MDFNINTALIDRATKPYADAEPGDTIVAIDTFVVDGTRVPRGATGTFAAGNLIKVNDYDGGFALDGYDDCLRAVPNALDYPAGHESQPVGNIEPDMVPDVLERSTVERIIREFAEAMGYPTYGQRLIEQLPHPETGHIVKATVLAASQADANDKVEAALRGNGLDFVIES